MANNVKSEIKNTGFADIPCDETIHRDDNHIFHLCNPRCFLNIKH